jgi:hypothetical protein
MAGELVACSASEISAASFRKLQRCTNCMKSQGAEIENPLPVLLPAVGSKNDSDEAKTRLSSFPMPEGTLRK